MTEFNFTINQLDGFQNISGNPDSELVIAEILDQSGTKMLQVVCTSHNPEEEQSNICLKINGNILEKGKDISNMNRDLGFQKITTDDDIFIVKWDIPYTINFDVKDEHYYISVGSNSGYILLRNSALGSTTSSSRFKYVFYNGDNQGDRNYIEKFPNQTLQSSYYQSMGSWDILGSNSSTDITDTSVDVTTSNDVNINTDDTTINDTSITTDDTTISDTIVETDYTVTTDDKIDVSDIAFNVTEQTSNKDTEATTQLSVNNTNNEPKNNESVGGAIMGIVIALLVGIIGGFVLEKLLDAKINGKSKSKKNNSVISDEVIQNISQEVRVPIVSSINNLKDSVDGLQKSLKNQMEIYSVNSQDIDKKIQEVNDETINTISREINNLSEQIEKLTKKISGDNSQQRSIINNTGNNANLYLSMENINSLIRNPENRGLVYSLTDRRLRYREGNESNYYIIIPCPHEPNNYIMYPYYIGIINISEMSGITEYFDCKNNTRLDQNSKWEACKLDRNFQLLKKGRIL